MEKYDRNNVFARIIRGELPCKKIYEDEGVLCFEDITKAATIHWLIVPKGDYTCFDDFATNASAESVADFFQKINKIAREHGLDKAGYKIISNNGEKVGQSVFHFHIHLLSGEGLWHL